ncbi:class I SAM-dependent methyltransferase [bacterium]|nr:class I SAM-dependent methyltransferase [candidate division CSSED10-310 bacterium]
MSLNRLYDDLAWLWPIWGDPEAEYRFYCDHVSALFHKYAKRNVHSVLNVGCGGGKNAFNLKREFDVTGLDISPEMLKLAKKLNPECRFVQADMRCFELGQCYDAILIDDAVAYMITEEDLRSVFRSAYRHLASGGVMITGPDDTTETFRQNSTEIFRSGLSLTPPGIEVTYIVNDYDPVPEDTWYESVMVFLIRENGKLRIEQDLHIIGLFPIERWRAILIDIGFEVNKAEYRDESNCYTQFVGVKK